MQLASNSRITLKNIKPSSEKILQNAKKTIFCIGLMEIMRNQDGGNNSRMLPGILTIVNHL